VESTKTRAPIADGWQEHLETPSLDPATPALSSEAPTLAVADDRSGDRGLSLLLFAIRERELSLVDMPLLQESAVELAALARAELAAIRLDATVLDDLRTFVQSVDILAVVSLPARAAKAAVGRFFTSRPRARKTEPDASYPSHVRKIRITPVVPDGSAKPRTRRVPGRLVGRVRFGRVLTRGVLVGLLVTVAMTMPPEVAAKLATEATSTAGVVATEVASTVASVATEVAATIGSVANTVGSTIGEKLAAAQPAPTLARADFEVPPLSAYGAAFETQAPYPTVQPNATVEWVVALRNTGSAGWYRGIDGAQASLALADGKEVAVQTTPYVGPGQVGWFVVHFTAPSTPGSTKIHLLPRINGRGSLPDLGIFATVTVSPNP
jgi:hypothetical protein